MKKSHPELYIVNIGDVHLLHRQTSTEHILSNLNQVLADPVETAKIDMLCFTGDIFDTRGSLSDPAVPRINEWIANTLKKAKQHDIVVRVLKGTPLHDWEQSQLWESINAIADIGADLRYVKTVSVEYIERLGISMLYVPDEANSSTQKTLSQVRELLHAKGMDQVDFAMMHGQFDYQIDALLDAHKTHDSDAYLALVREFIMVGHVHTYNRRGRIIPPGSFDRLKHGEEEAKGHVRILTKKDGEHEVRFIENKGAKRYVTVPCKGLDLTETLAQVDKYIKDLPIDSYVRIEADTGNPVLTNMQQVVLKYPEYNWSKISRKEKKVQEEEAAALEKTFQHVALTKDNLGDMWLARVAKANPKPEVLAAARQLIGEVL